MTQINLMALRHSAFYTPFLLTIAGGFLKEEGLQPTYTVATPHKTVPDSIADGSCQVAQSAVATNFAALESGLPSKMVHFAQINSLDGFFLAARKPDPNFTWHQLEGKKVLVDHFFQPMAMLKYGLHQQGIEFDNMDIIDAGDVTAMEVAFRAGLGDYVHLQGPAPQQLEFEKLGYVVAAVGELVGTVAFSSLCAEREWLNTPMAMAFVRAYRRAREYAASAPAEEIAAQEAQAGFFPGVQRQVLCNTIAAYQRMGCWQGDIAISHQSYEKLIDIFLYNGLISQRYNYAASVVTPPV